MLSAPWYWLQRLFLTPFQPDGTAWEFLTRATTHRSHDVELTVAVPDAAESERLFGVPVARHGLQSVYLRVVNHSTCALRLQFRGIDPHYFPPLEASAQCHFSILKRLSAFGALGWLFLPLLWLFVPLKLLSVGWANRRMDDWFQHRAFHRRPIPPGSTTDGFVYTPVDVGSKLVRVRLMVVGSSVPSSDVTLDRGQVSPLKPLADNSTDANSRRSARQNSAKGATRNSCSHVSRNCRLRLRIATLGAREIPSISSS